MPPLTSAGVGHRHLQRGGEHGALADVLVRVVAGQQDLGAGQTRSAQPGVVGALDLVRVGLELLAVAVLAAVRADALLQQVELGQLGLLVPGLDQPLGLRRQVDAGLGVEPEQPGHLGDGLRGRLVLLDHPVVVGVVVVQRELVVDGVAGLGDRRAQVDLAQLLALGVALGLAGLGDRQRAGAVVERGPVGRTAVELRRRGDQLEGRAGRVLALDHLVEQRVVGVLVQRDDGGGVGVGARELEDLRVVRGIAGRGDDLTGLRVHHDAGSGGREVRPGGRVVQNTRLVRRDHRDGLLEHVLQEALDAGVDAEDDVVAWDRFGVADHGGLVAVPVQGDLLDAVGAAQRGLVLALDAARADQCVGGVVAAVDGVGVDLAEVADQVGGHAVQRGLVLPDALHLGGDAGVLVLALEDLQRLVGVGGVGHRDRLVGQAGVAAGRAGGAVLLVLAVPARRDRVDQRAWVLVQQGGQPQLDRVALVRLLLQLLPVGGDDQLGLVRRVGAAPVVEDLTAGRRRDVVVRGRGRGGLDVLVTGEDLEVPEPAEQGQQQRRGRAPAG